ncbi:hypothetical protein TEA_025518 [Camellia sinensis var. sinensis]|uniref:Uncharacterized protein n=1 Tax=Camellia sinensis var. sinensis TaxID=542762 RepID=A0A4S4CX13_CAMSN|nr:hypothetical protein TEA_025518 [Camellia sinensis var. sinensis]
MPNWELKKCCNHEQVVFLSTISICTVVILALWRTILLLPFKLVTVFLHEASHAIACKLTCGHVEAIQVNADEDLGSAFWGMVLILASTNLLTARIAAGCFAFALLVVLFVAKNGIHIFFVSLWIHVPWPCDLVLRTRGILLFIWKLKEVIEIMENMKDKVDEWEDKVDEWKDTWQDNNEDRRNG